MTKEDILRSLVEKKAIHLSNQNPFSIHWLEKLDKRNLSKGVLSGEYFQVLGNEYPLVKVNRQIKTRFFKFRINDIKIETIVKFANDNGHKANEALYIHFLEETKKIRSYKEWMGNVDGYDIKFIKSQDYSFISQRTFIKSLEKIGGLDVSNLNDKISLFTSGYDGGTERFSKKNFDGVTMLESEQEALINQVVRDATINPERYKKLIDDLSNVN